MRDITGTSLILGAMMACGPGAASGTGYVATLQSPASRHAVVAHDLLWRCSGDRCVAQESHSRPVILCEALVRIVGPMIRFASADGPLSTEQLARCNAADETRPKNSASKDFNAALPEKRS